MVRFEAFYVCYQAGQKFGNKLTSFPSYADLVYGPFEHNTVIRGFVEFQVVFSISCHCMVDKFCLQDRWCVDGV